MRSNTPPYASDAWRRGRFQGLEEAPKDAALHVFLDTAMAASRPPFGFRISDPFEDDALWVAGSNAKIEVAGAATARARRDTRHAEDLTGSELVWHRGLVAQVLCLRPAQRLIIAAWWTGGGALSTEACVLLWRQ
ncbi:hypothetical protein ACHAQJ_009667 [Trichoderma viride]